VDRELDVDQAHHAQAQGDQLRGLLNLSQHLGAEGHRGDHARGVPGVHAGLLDVLHDRPDPDLVAVAEGVDVDLDRVLQEAVEEDRARLPVRACAREVVGQAVLRIADLHRPAAQHVRGPHQQRIANVARHGKRLLRRLGCRPRRAAQAKLVEHASEARPVLGEVDRLHRGAEQAHAGVGQPLGELERGLAPELHDHALRLLEGHDR
jgi:hypothetical protein